MSSTLEKLGSKVKTLKSGKDTKTVKTFDTKFTSDITTEISEDHVVLSTAKTSVDELKVMHVKSGKNKNSETNQSDVQSEKVSTISNKTKNLSENKNSETSISNDHNSVEKLLVDPSQIKIDKECFNKDATITVTSDNKVCKNLCTISDCSLIDTETVIQVKK
ncbi:hypothetical protein CEXT_546681 [Caerostris extrusa]|uniref:Uncharacterized protein n=1 Tax=Caerostris extrusa TaxID=172846 RepID=A0AAV4VUA1_CAEEX|nr:hypothetical protein CEXT_546681 [Caerostris extrusa]